MATTAVSIEATLEDGRALAVLGDLIRKREAILQHETTENAVTATAINILGSLRAATRKGPLAANGEMYKVTCEVVGGAGWRNRRRVAVRDGHRIKDLRPVNQMYGLKGGGNLYKISITNKNLEPKTSVGNLNAPYYYILAPNEAVAVKYAKARVERALKKESGMAKYALGIAQAKASNRAMNQAAPSGSNQMRAAFEAARVTKAGSGVGSGSFSFEFFDALDYSELALRGTSTNDAMMKAANKTYGMLKSYLEKHPDIGIDIGNEKPFNL